MNGETYIVCIDEFSATCSWQIVGVQVEQDRCKDSALRKAITLGSPRSGVIADVHPEVPKTSVPDSVICYCQVQKDSASLGSAEIHFRRKW